ncbi:hypothetical protein MRX96_027221 [Rhipicephalus microplus]
MTGRIGGEGGAGRSKLERWEMKGHAALQGSPLLNKTICPCSEKGSVVKGGRVEIAQLAGCTQRAFFTFGARGSFVFHECAAPLIGLRSSAPAKRRQRP